MLTDREVLSTINMLRSEHLDVRTVTMGINLFDWREFGLRYFRLQSAFEDFPLCRKTRCNL